DSEVFAVLQGCPRVKFSTNAFQNSKCMKPNFSLTLGVVVQPSRLCRSAGFQPPSCQARLPGLRHRQDACATSLAHPDLNHVSVRTAVVSPVSTASRFWKAAEAAQMPSGLITGLKPGDNERSSHLRSDFA